MAEQGNSRRIFSLFNVWIALQFIQYNFFKPNLNIHVIVTLSPDRVAFVWLLMYFMLSGTRVRQRVSLAAPEYLMVLFAVVCLLSYLYYAPDQGQVSRRWLTTIFNIVVFPFGIYVMAKNTFFAPEYLEKLAKTFLWLGAFFSINGLSEHYRLDWLVWPRYILDSSIGIQWGRLRGPFVNATMFGVILNVSFLFMTFRLKQVKGFARMILTAVWVLNAVCIYFTYTRGIWVCMAVNMLLIFLFRRDERPMLSFLAALMFIAAAVGVGSKFTLFQGTLMSKRGQTIDYRLANADTSLKMVMAHPLTGIGYGKYLNEWPNYFDVNYKDNVPDLGDGNHNMFLGLAAELGVVGLVLYLGVLVVLLKRNVSVYRKLSSSNSAEKDFAFISILVLCVYFLIGQTSDLRYHGLFNGLVFMFSGIVASMNTALTRDAWQANLNLGSPQAIALPHGKHGAAVTP